MGPPQREEHPREEHPLWGEMPGRDRSYARRVTTAELLDLPPRRTGRDRLIEVPPHERPAVAAPLAGSALAFAERWREEIAIAAGGAFLVEAAIAPVALEPSVLLPLLGVGIACIALPLAHRIRARRELDALLDGSEAAGRARLTAALDTRLGAIVDDLALAVGLHDGDVRVYRRDAAGFELAVTRAGRLEAMRTDGSVLTTAWTAGIARQPQRAGGHLYGMRVDDRRDAAPLAVVVVDASDQVARRIRSSSAWEQLTAFVEVARTVVA